MDGSARLARAAYEVTPFEAYVAELRQRGIVVETLDGATADV